MREVFQTKGAGGFGSSSRATALQPHRRHARLCSCQHRRLASAQTASRMAPPATSQPAANGRALTEALRSLLAVVHQQARSGLRFRQRPRHTLWKRHRFFDSQCHHRSRFPPQKRAHIPGLPSTTTRPRIDHRPTTPNTQTHAQPFEPVSASSLIWVLCCCVLCAI